MSAATFRERILSIGVSGADVLAMLGIAAHRAGAGNALIRCPAHDDDRPSLSVHLATGRAHCFGCGFKVGDAVALYKALAKSASMGDALRDLESRHGIALPPLVLRPAIPRRNGDRATPEGAPEEVRRWSYRFADGRAAFDIARFQFRLPDGSWLINKKKNKPEKDYRPAAPGSTRWGMPPGFDAPGSRPLLGLPELLAAPADADVFITEGEPPCDALCGEGSLATTSCGGASAPEKTDWAPLAGRHVVIWPDNDTAGRAYADRVVDILRRLRSRPEVDQVDIDKLELPPGGDAVDWVERRWADR